MKAVPWILVLIFLATAGFLFSKSQEKEKEAAQLRQENAELPELRAALEAAKNVETQDAEATLTGKEREELIRLRNEVGTLRKEKQQLSTQVQTAQQSREKLLEAQKTQQEQARQVFQLQQQNQQLAQQNQLSEATKAMNACINNLRQIDGAKQQWALENKQTADASPIEAHVGVYLRSEKLPACPSGGVYTLGKVSDVPTCSIAGHAIAQ